MKRIWWMVMLLLLASLISACAETAADLTKLALFNGSSGSGHSAACRDGDNETFYTGRKLTITAPAGETIGSLELKWRTLFPPAVRIEAHKNGAWVEMMHVELDYAVQYIVLPEACNEIRVSAQSGELELCEVTVLGPGTAPDDVQIWRDPPEKVDLMLLSTHPDDEVLWFGGLLPYYAGEQKKDVLVVNAVFGWYCRRLELLDALWTCGVDIYPVMLRYPDKGDAVEVVHQAWSERDPSPTDRLVSLLRQYKPDVVVLHDVDGEYGHTAHILFSKLGRQAVMNASKASEHVASAAQWGLWDVPKTYIHLWEYNEIGMDWKQPLTAFNGMTGIEVAKLAMQCHKSQISRGWAVKEGGSYDNARFGLWRTTVGDDVLKNDMFENIPW